MLWFELRNNSGLSPLKNFSPPVHKLHSHPHFGKKWLWHRVKATAMASTWRSPPLLNWRLPRCTFQWRVRCLALGLRYVALFWNLVFYFAFFFLKQIINPIKAYSIVSVEHTRKLIMFDVCAFLLVWRAVGCSKGSCSLVSSDPHSESESINRAKSGDNNYSSLAKPCLVLFLKLWHFFLHFQSNICLS